MIFTFQVEVEVEHIQGKFAARDEIADVISEWLDMANEGSVDSVGADGDSTYEVTGWSVAEQSR